MCNSLPGHTGRNRRGMSYFGMRKWCERMTALFIFRRALRELREVRVHNGSESEVEVASGSPIIIETALRMAYVGTAYLFRKAKEGGFRRQGTEKQMRRGRSASGGSDLARTT